MSEEMKKAIDERIKEMLQNGDLKYDPAPAVEETKTTKKEKKTKVGASNATRPITVEEFELIIDTIQAGFEYEETKVVYADQTKETVILPIGDIAKKDFPVGTMLETKKRKFRANDKLSFILQLQANLGMRIGDILALTPGSFIPNGCGGYKLNVIEQKTGKPRTFEVTFDTINAIEEYAANYKLDKNDLLFTNKERGIQKQLKIVCDYLQLQNVSTHSFRKFYAMRIFENNNYNFEVVRELLQHSNVGVTQKYLGVTTKEVQSAIQGHSFWK